MPARPREHISQRRLVHELRIAIDRARGAHTEDAHRKAMQEVHDLVNANPTSSRSRYVAHNLGRARHEWLMGLMAHAHASAMSLHSNPTR